MNNGMKYITLLQLRVLAAVHARAGEGMAEISEHLKYDKGTLKACIRKLVAHKLIVMEKFAKQRFPGYRATAAGSKLLASTIASLTRDYTNRFRAVRDEPFLATRKTRTLTRD